MNEKKSRTSTSPPELEPQTQKFIDSLVEAGGPPIYTLSPLEARAVLAGAQSAKVPMLPAQIENMSLPVGPTGKVSVRIVRPEGIKGILPVVLYLHGGGWILGDWSTHERLVREIANGACVAVVFVDFDRSPETQYPVAVEQSFAVAEYVVENAKSLNLDASRLAVAGDSVGGNMCAAVTLMAKQREWLKIRFQVLFYPVTDANFSNGSYNRFENGPWLTKLAMQWFWDAYLPDKSKRAEITACPLNSSIEQLKGLPEALVITAENDVLRDEGEAYARKLSAAGVRVTALRCIGAIHDFVMLNALSETPAARSAISLANHALRAAFEKRAWKPVTP